MFAIYIAVQQGIAVILYTDDTMLIAPSVIELEKLLHVYEEELDYLDMKVNFSHNSMMVVGQLPQNWTTM